MDWLWGIVSPELAWYNGLEASGHGEGVAHVRRNQHHRVYHADGFRAAPDERFAHDPTIYVCRMHTSIPMILRGMPCQIGALV
jgi:hypothetical protein